MPYNDQVLMFQSLCILLFGGQEVTEVDLIKFQMPNTQEKAQIHRIYSFHLKNYEKFALVFLMK